MQLVCFSTGKLIPCIKHRQNKKIIYHICETGDRAARQGHHFNGKMQDLLQFFYGNGIMQICFITWANMA